MDGNGIPEVKFDVGESYAGQLPISNNSTDENKMFFWFFPSQNPLAKKEIMIWLNGGVLEIFPFSLSFFFFFSVLCLYFVSLDF